MDNCCEKRKKLRNAEQKAALMRRLNIISGQIKGINGMIESDAYCPDILLQISAVSAALTSLSQELLSSHIKSCVVSDIKEGREDSAEELARLALKLIR